MYKNPLDDIEDIERPITWQNFALSTKGILDLFRDSNLGIDDLRVANPTKIPIDDSSVVSIFLFSIKENALVRKHSTSVFTEPEKEYSYFETTLQFLVSAHSNDHFQEISTLEKLLGIVYATPSLFISSEIKKLHLRVNLKDDPVEVWEKLFASTPYRLSFLLTVHGPGVTYLTPQKTPAHRLELYDPTEEPEEIFTV
jgi:hypothetical protein